MFRDKIEKKHAFINFHLDFHMLVETNQTNATCYFPKLTTQ